ncbi:MAG: glycosyltransferase [Ignavibacteria bacterium]
MSGDIKHITVLMSVYNDSEYLKASVRSVLNQTHKDFEFLIVDDGSDEDPEEIIKEFRDSRIVYKKIKHRGLAGALNYGLMNSSGDWVARIDADDLSTLNRIKTQVAFLNSNKETDVLSSWSVYFENKNKILFSLKTPVTDKKIKSFLNLHNPVNHSSVMFNKKKILADGGYNENYISYEDFELWFRMKDKLSFRILPEFLVYTRFRKNSMTMTGSKKMICELLIDNARSNLEISKSSKDKKYWNTILFWIEYFYGDKERSRDYYSKDITFKKSLGYLNTFLPENGFKKLIGLRLRQRIASPFGAGKKFKEELDTLLK